MSDNLVLIEDKHDKRLTIRVHETYVNYINETSSALGLSKSEFVRQCIKMAKDVIEGRI